MPAYSLDGRLGKVIVRGGKLSAEVAARVVAGSLSLSATEVTQLTLTLVEGPDFDLLDSGLFEAGTPTKAGSRCDYGGLALEVRATEISARGDDHVLIVTARSYGAGRLKRTRGPLVRRQLSPTRFAKLLAEDAGLTFVGQPSPTRKTIAIRTTKKDADTAEAETAWDTIQRLAAELGFVCFEAIGVLYFGKPTWLVEHTDSVLVAWKGKRTTAALDRLPTCRRSGDDPKRYATVEVDLRGAAGEAALPGMALDLSGVPTYDGRYMVDSVTLPLAENQPAQVSASTPTNPEPQPPEKHAKTSPGPGGAGDDADADDLGSKSAATFVAIALRQAGDAYVYAAEASATDADPNAFDCSELVQWAAARAGVTFVDGSAAQIAACKPISVEQGIATRGALLWHEGHIAISLGNGNTIEAANSRVGVVSYSAAGRFTRAGLIPGLRY